MSDTPTPSVSPTMETQPLIDVVERIDMDPYRQVDPYYVGNKDPNMYYCWLRNKPQDLAINRSLGQYEICNKQNIGTATPLVDPSPTGEYRIADSVLAQMPRRRYEALERHRIEDTKAQMKGANEQWIGEAQRAGLNVNDTTKSEPFVRKL